MLRGIGCHLGIRNCTYQVKLCLAHVMCGRGCLSSLKLRRVIFVAQTSLTRVTSYAIGASITSTCHFISLTDLTTTASKRRSANAYSTMKLSMVPTRSEGKRCVEQWARTPHIKHTALLAADASTTRVLVKLVLPQWH